MQGYVNTAWLEAPSVRGFAPWIDGEARFNVQVSPHVQGFALQAGQELRVDLAAPRVRGSP